MGIEFRRTGNTRKSSELSKTVDEWISQANYETIARLLHAFDAETTRLDAGPHETFVIVASLMARAVARTGDGKDGARTLSLLATLVENLESVRLSWPGHRPPPLH